MTLGKGIFHGLIPPVLCLAVLLSSAPAAPAPYNVALNCSFEEGPRIPAAWEGRELRRRDRRVCRTGHKGDCSFRILGGRGPKSLVQTWETSGNYGDVFTVKGWSRVLGADPGGGFYGLKAVVHHLDGSSETHRARFRKRASGWHSRKKSFTINKPCDRIEFSAHFSRQTGRAWFDDVKLTREALLTVPVLDLPALMDAGQLRQFVAFGAVIDSHLNPTYEFRTWVGGLPVYAATPGEVVRVDLHPGIDTDWEIDIRPFRGSAFNVIYDHVVDLRVAVGDKVAAGDRLGNLGAWTGIPDSGRVELQVNWTETDPGGAVTGVKALCPRFLGSIPFNAVHDAAFAGYGIGGDSVCVTGWVTP